MVTEKKKNLSVKKTKEKLLVITNGAKKRNYGVHATWINWSILLLTSLIISILLFPGILIRPPSYRLGDIADKDIKASRDFLVEDVELTEQKRREAVKATPPVFDLDPTGSYILSRIREAFSAGRKGMVVQSPVKEDGQGPVGSNHVQINQEIFSQLIGVQVDEATYNILSRAGFPPEVENTIIKLLSRVLDRGVIGDKNLLASISSQKIVLHNLETGKETVLTETNEFLDMKEAANFIRKEAKALRPLMPKELRAATIDLAMQLLRPNITFNKRETELRKEAAKESVKPFYFKVKKGEMLVREGEKITKKHLLKLSEHSKYLRPKRLLGHLPAMFILVGLLLLSFYYLSYRPVLKGKPNPKNLVFCSIVLLAMLLVVMASHLVVSEIIRSFTSLSPTSLLFAIPVASASMLLSIFHGLSVATGLGAVLSILSSLVLGHGVELFVYFFVSSLVAAYGVRECRERGVFIKTGLKLSLINVLMALAVETLHGPTYGINMLYAGASAFVGGMLVAVIATGSLPLIEMAFGYTTDIKLLELASLDQPLLRRLLLEAPGTYHHSVIVSNMVEATAKAVGANPLLAKVAAYYHDIGKMKKALYFIENQLPGQNKHEKLAPSMSALILISHVKDGVELARKHKLGNEIMDIIGQHHGTTLITYFYEKAREQAEKREGKTIKVKEEDFRYPGPKPQTKEAGLVMLADMVEAASKSLADPTPARIQGLVQKIINRAFSDGQLDECELTLKDLHQIAKSFNKTLTGIFHQRIEYPGIEIGSSGGKKASNGNLNQVGLTNSRAEKAGNKEENGETLRRLGLS
ncbi:MAG TPA: HDIG domain-containing protein [Desulfobacterales bacterium]|nr:HDIG domain-containing protein [Desulfobacterales bacterium]